MEISCQKKKRKSCKKKKPEKRGLCELPDELILKVFSLLPLFEETLARRLISKYWEGPWKLDPNVMFDDGSPESFATFMSFVYGSLMSNDAQILECLHLKLRQNYPVTDINFCVQIGVYRSVRELRIALFGKTLEFPCCLSTCRTLKELVLHNLCIEVVPLWFRLPSLKTLKLLRVKFSGDSVASLLRTFPVLEHLVVDQTKEEDSLISKINVPTLRRLSIHNRERTPWYMSVGTNFSSLEHLKLCTCFGGWRTLLACILNDTPKLRSLTLKLKHKAKPNDDLQETQLWEKPPIVPECLSTHLEILKWRGYAGTKHEKSMVRYILANAACLKKATFSTKCRNQCDTRFRALRSMYKVSEKCQLVFD
ncbi:hypothetical protein CARUB_v10027899mg [Capsella rubella]|uniref:FBD domain-containing protein n=1 Tax=Capsella rubella TaxID=81985 RepID=R0F069_9BRAS|nr:hypothetical protein CARUB_v10027899mg [Capsella rubella]